MLHKLVDDLDHAHTAGHFTFQKPDNIFSIKTCTVLP